MNASTSPKTAEPRLTSLSHGGGCGCKIAPGVLSSILRGTTQMPVPAELLVGIETADDAAVYKLNDHQALVATTDFFMPIVDDPFDFGRIAATNALSDVYAMGGTPIMALAVVGMPINVLSAALKKNELPADGYAQMIAATTRLNTPGPALAALPGVHAITDVTGFALAGHALELARGAGVTVQIDWPAVPLLPGVRELAAQGIVTGASGRNWAAYGAEVALPEGFADAERALLTDPQTSGGLLVACAPESLRAVLDVFKAQGFGDAAVVGRVLPKGEKPLVVAA